MSKQEDKQENTAQRYFVPLERPIEYTMPVGGGDVYLTQTTDTVMVSSVLMRRGSMQRPQPETAIFPMAPSVNGLPYSTEQVIYWDLYCAAVQVNNSSEALDFVLGWYETLTEEEGD